MPFGAREPKRSASTGATRRQETADRFAQAPPAGEPVVACRPSIRARLEARWRSGRLDLALANGAPAEGSPALALRARRLTRSSHRRLIGEALVCVTREAREGAPRSRTRVSPDRGRLAPAARELDRLASSLVEPGPVSARGVAQARILLTDGMGPLFNPHSSESLLACVVGATENLRPWNRI